MIDNYLGIDQIRVSSVLIFVREWRAYSPLTEGILTFVHVKNC